MFWQTTWIFRKNGKGWCGPTSVIGTSCTKTIFRWEGSDLKDDTEFAGFNIGFLKVSKSTLKQIDAEIDADDKMKRIMQKPLPAVDETKRG